ncbi:hypothetical protein CROQUDRAFT_47295 [Cronartium quercuum f. sp. fusiforme G11]|uniref:BTB domain-containing protein n=1 Tax=Cronartium quercuum f. sp. fusiforme G11 TaxID=708437 RepID=A0A9P6ND10_9BASI|nr:hypothetical protein CROQUDRAFT_47295 [Cronartium quercuum f. sp. fusiforme G11]
MPVVSFSIPQIDTKSNNRSTTTTSSSSSSGFDLRSPLSTLRSTTTSYYHPSYCLSNSIDVDLVLSSSDEIPCWFAINKSKLFGHTDIFKSVGLEQLTPDHHLPLVQLGESRDVIELILTCSEADSIPDFTKIEFNVLVSALEAAADKYKLIHTEKICLLALGAYCTTNPVQVYTLAIHYNCKWLAEAASEHTLSLNINHPDYQDILTSEGYAPLMELHQYRISKAKQIIEAIMIPKTKESLKLSNFWINSSQRLVDRIDNPILNIDEIFKPELHLAIQELNPCLKSYSDLIDIRDQIRNECNHIRKRVDLSIITIPKTQIH